MADRIAASRFRKWNMAMTVADRTIAPRDPLAQAGCALPGRANRFNFYRRCFAPKLARPQKSLSRNLQFAQAFQGDLRCCPVPPEKIFCFAATPNHQHLSRHPASQEGRFAVVTNVGCRMRWTRSGARRATLIRLPQSFGGLVPKPSSRLLRKVSADGEVVWS